MSQVRTYTGENRHPAPQWTSNICHLTSNDNPRTPAGVSRYMCTVALQGVNTTEVELQWCTCAPSRQHCNVEFRLAS